MTATPLLHLLVFVAAICLVFGIAALFDRERLPSPLSIRKGNPVDDVITTRISNTFVPDSESKRARLRLWLLQAGFDSPKAVQAYYGFRITLLVALPVVVTATSYLTFIDRRHVFVSCVVAAVSGFMFPAYYVSRRRRQRQRLASDGFPDMLDLLLVCSEAGLGIDTAIMKVGEELADTHPILSEHLQQVMRELRAGRPRLEAMRTLADRTGIEQASSLVNLLVQSDILGASISATLRAFSEDMREKRILRAEEMGYKVGVKLSVIAVACFLPALIMVVMTPVLFTIMSTFHKVLTRS